MFWHVCGLSAKYELPFQIHTGQARIQGSNPMLLVDLIEAGLQSKEAEKERFFSLVSRLTDASDAAERERLKEELARMTFGG